MFDMALWHDIIRERDSERLEEVLADDCVFHSPILHTPQEGKDLTKYYIAGAMMVFNDSFHYVKEVVTNENAVLEFVCDVDGIIINGVDIMTFDEAGKITEFKVMIRPLKAIEMMHTKMRELL
ncbi:MAG: nuclear transport factor 2 family protein [Proteobacteria bacterium]|nr:nuclear transport factor 2 family protein [Pseudomonadota bacterium]